MQTALILAGGESRRFGGPKAFIEIGGRPMIARVADVVGPLADETIVSVQSPEAETRIRPILPRVALVVDAHPGRGPIEGIRQGFRAAHGDLVLVAPCDAPFLQASLYRLLLASLGDHDGAIPTLEVADPVRAVYRRDRVIEVLDASSSLGSPSALVDRLHCVFVGPDRIRDVDADLSSFMDVNTRVDLEAVLRKDAGVTRGPR